MFKNKILPSNLEIADLSDELLEKSVKEAFIKLEIFRILKNLFRIILIFNFLIAILIYPFQEYRALFYITMLTIVPSMIFHNLFRFSETRILQIKEYLERKGHKFY